jgi:hypothetical protein
MMKMTIRLTVYRVWDNLAELILSSKIVYVYNIGALYKICIVARGDSFIFKHKPSTKLMISLENIDETEETKDLSDVPKDQDFQKINTQVDKMTKKIIGIMKSQNYQIMKEDEYSIRQMNMSEVIEYATIVQIVILTILTIWQVISLKRTVNLTNN